MNKNADGSGTNMSLAEIRSRLSDISWFMRMVSEPVARRANAEEQVTGRFWQGRFRAVKLCDDAALLACSVYVDLNPIRAGISQTPEDSPHTSAALRIQQQQQPVRSAANWLAPLELDERQLPDTHRSTTNQRCSDKGFLPLTLDDYLMLLDWTGRQVVRGKSGKVPAELAPILSRLGIEQDHWFRLSTRFGQLFYSMAGRRSSLAHEAARRRRRWYQAPGGQLLPATAA